MKYCVTLADDGCYTVEVEMDNIEQAKEAAKDAFWRRILIKWSALALRL